LYIKEIQESRPSRARGLKQAKQWRVDADLEVAPFTGAWIETSYLGIEKFIAYRRALHGRVD